MHVHFGPQLDGLDPVPARTSLGEIAVGPQGLIRILETDLGLAPVLEHPAEQLTAYLGCLAQVDDAGRFYHRSFAVDPINVARTLMRWRERWYESGWNGLAPADAAPRIRDMAAVEAIAAARVALCQGQRVMRILDALECARTQISRITLREVPAALPWVWRRLVERIGFDLADGVVPAVRARAGTDLFRLQTLLLEDERARETPGASIGTEPVALAGDGSLLVVRAASRDISARAIAEMLAADGRLHATAVVAERDGIILDNAMERSALPRSGFQHYSRFRAVAQVQKLALALLWEPLRPRQLLQFLVHPLGPVDARIRRALAEAVAEAPGVGGRAWRGAVERLTEWLREQGDDAAADGLPGVLGYWFEGPRHPPADGAPIAVIAERAQRCADWLRGRFAVAEGSAEQTHFATSLAQADALIGSLARFAEQGRERIAQIELERLVDEVGREQPDPAQFREVGAARAATDPANVTGAWAQVVWWDLGPEREDFGYPWSRAELADLRALGVALPSVEARLAARARAWLRPIVNCTDRLVLVVHHTDAGDHPLWTRITSRVTGFAVVDLEAVLLDGGAERIPHLGVEVRPLSLRSLPAPTRWWHLPPEAKIPVRPLESYSSLSRLYFHTHEWVLSYPAALRRGRAEDLPDGPLLYGNLGHRLFESFFAAHPDREAFAAVDAGRWAAAELPLLVAREGAVLLEPGRGVDREQVLVALERALARLVAALLESDVVRVEAERREQAPFVDGVAVHGAIDLLLTRANGEEVVVDAKWGGERNRAQEIEANLHLQLASYAYLRKSASGANAWPYQAYFIITTGNVLAADASVFPGAVVRGPDAGADPEVLWRRALATYRWRRAQLDAGLIEVNVAQTAPTRASAAPEDALDTRVEPDRFDEFGRLTGWDSFS